MRILVAILLPLWLLACSGGENKPVWPGAVGSYVDTLATVEKAAQPVSMQPLFAAAIAAQDQLMAIQGDGDRAWQETLSDDDYARLRQDLRGLILSRGHDVYAQPDGRFFATLAQAQGVEEDRQFFALYAALWTAEMLPKYLNLGTGQAPCVRFGEGIISTLYRDWWSFSVSHPQAYTDFAQQLFRDLEEVMALGTCACGGVESVRKELREFTTQFPHSAATESARQRLGELSREDIDHYVQCR